MGGANISLLNLARGLIEKGVEVAFVAPDKDPKFLNHASQLGIRMYFAPVIFSVTSEDNSGWLRRIFHALHSSEILVRTKYASYCGLCSIVEQYHPDIIHTNVGVNHEGYDVAKFFGIPHVWHLREYQDSDFDMHFYPSKKFFCQRLKDPYVVTITKDILHHFGLKEDKGHCVIYNGIMSEKDIHYIENKEKYFLCASRIDPSKGHIDVIKAFSLIYQNHPDYRLRVLGFGSEGYLSELKRLAQQLGCADAIDWVGYTEKVSEHMQHATALIVASKFEGFGRMTAEAFFNGCMVIGRNTGGTKEIMDQTGGISFMGGPDKLAEKIEQVITMTKEEYKQIVLKGQKKAAKTFSIEQNIDHIFNLYQYIFQRKQVPTRNEFKHIRFTDKLKFVLLLLKEQIKYISGELCQ